MQVTIMNIQNEVLQAEKLIKPYVRETPLEYSHYLSRLSNCNVFLKLENYQLTGSFKLRGATNKLLSLTQEQAQKGIITASSGNHGLGIAHALTALNYKGTIFLPGYTSKAKIEAIKNYNVPIEFYGNSCEETELYARKLADENNQVYISPYNDIKIIGGQGTIGVELERQLDKIDCLFASVGGGGLISGIAGYLKSVNKDIKIIGCLPEKSPVMSESVKAGKIIDLPAQETISDGTAGNMEPGSITFELCRQFVDDYILVSEDKIRAAIKLFIEKHHMIIEGAAGVTVSSFLQEMKNFQHQNIVLVICGCNISPERITSILCTELCVYKIKI